MKNLIKRRNYGLISLSCIVLALMILFTWSSCDDNNNHVVRETVEDSSPLIVYKNGPIMVYRVRVDQKQLEVCKMRSKYGRYYGIEGDYALQSYLPVDIRVNFASLRQYLSIENVLDSVMRSNKRISNKHIPIRALLFYRDELIGFASHADDVKHMNESWLKQEYLFAIDRQHGSIKELFVDRSAMKSIYEFQKQLDKNLRLPGEFKYDLINCVNGYNWIYYCPVGPEQYPLFESTELYKRVKVEIRNFDYLNDDLSKIKTQITVGLDDIVRNRKFYIYKNDFWFDKGKRELSRAILEIDKGLINGVRFYDDSDVSSESFGIVTNPKKYCDCQGYGGNVFSCSNGKFYDDKTRYELEDLRVKNKNHSIFRFLRKNGRKIRVY